jgi:hypothetical protein
MHDFAAFRIASLSQTDWWTPASADLERIALALLGPLPGGWVRQGNNFVRIGNVKYGADARKLEQTEDVMS